MPHTPLSPAPDPPRRSTAPVETDNAHDDNVNFLRSRPALFNPLLPSLSRQRRRRYPTNPQNEDRMEVDDSTNPRTSVELNRRIPIVRRQERSTDMPNYEGRMTNSRSLYGWAPGSDDEDGAREESDDDQMQPFLHAISSRDTPPARPPRNEVPGPAQLIPHEYETLPGSNRPRPSVSAVAALIQSARRQPRLSRSRTLENYMIDRSTAEEAENALAAASRGYRYRPSSRGDSHHINLTHNDLRARATAHRQLHSDTYLGNVLGETIHYLERIRYSNSLEESMLAVADSRLPISMDNKAWRDTDFILYTPNIEPPAACSWLRSGMAFSGCQRAASAGCSVLSQRINSPRAPSEPVIVNGSDTTRVSVSTTSGRRYLANNRDENWPVKVTIHQINHDDMTLSGTMEAYNIPDKTSPTHDAHIVTFLEGEIIDFNNHTLETKNFKADADIDSTYWRELQPFKDLTDAEMARNIVSRKWITEELSKGWILMRWKERCFITPTDARQGLTISGFYYISLRREDGHIEGLYYDPGSSPYQQLSLNPEVSKMVRPSYAFR
ncbi:Vacuolar import/degradation protein Vid24 [Penicillium griseofulvum]|uniref:Vacuolar import/degradation protein Vid24 n=1 Tax=Penicillium patulum TaxID=5078 RepID=A0A135LDG7_PENPA|nr:Vacuolar import/degradation protein Vid24 [Penicillium griseofulvum]KXG47015.1 Vacuolar import/degradation protein Vid24 [Penicillium griseofulvum]